MTTRRKIRYRLNISWGGVRRKERRTICLETITVRQKRLATNELLSSVIIIQRAKILKKEKKTTPLFIVVPVKPSSSRSDVTVIFCFSFSSHAFASPRHLEPLTSSRPLSSRPSFTRAVVLETKHISIVTNFFRPPEISRFITFIEEEEKSGVSKRDIRLLILNNIE